MDKPLYHDDGQEMEITSGGHCRHIADVVIRAMLDLAAETAVDGRVSVADLRRIGTALMTNGGPMEAMCTLTEQACEVSFMRASIERQRRDSFGRLLVEPIAHLLDVPTGIERRRLGQFFTAIRMMVGEEECEDLRNRAANLAVNHRGVDGMVDWDSFHHDPKCAEIREHVLVSIARSFHRFDGRRDWFLVVLNASPTAVSIGSTSFVPLKPEERAKLAFTGAHMLRLFDAMFACVQRDTFYGERTRIFSRRWNASPDKVFGNFFLELARMKQKEGL